MWCRKIDIIVKRDNTTLANPLAAPPEGNENLGSGGGGRARALFNFVPEAEEELSIKVSLSEQIVSPAEPYRHPALKERGFPLSSLIFPLNR